MYVVNLKSPEREIRSYEPVNDENNKISMQPTKPQVAQGKNTIYHMASPLGVI